MAGLAFSRTRRFHQDYHVVLNTAEDILTWMGFGLRYRNPSTGRLLFDSDRDSTGANGYLEVVVTEEQDAAVVTAEADSYHIWSGGRFMNILGWFLYNLETLLDDDNDPRSNPPVMYGHKVTGPFQPSSDPGRPRGVVTFERPSRAGPMALAVVPVLIMLVVSSFSIGSVEDVMVVLLFMSPFLLGAVLIGTGFLRAGGALCIFFGIFTGLVFGPLAWLLIFGTGQYAGAKAMTSGRWWNFHERTREELGAVEG